MSTTETEVILELAPDSDLAKALDAAGKTPVVLVTNGHRYLVRREPGNFEVDNAREEFRAALRAAAGVFTPEEADQLRENVYRWREEGSRPINRP
jgi:hypothetical protein